MSAVISSTTGRPYGVALVCQVWVCAAVDVLRSSVRTGHRGHETEATWPPARDIGRSAPGRDQE